jgi:hypothetical protein
MPAPIVSAQIYGDISAIALALRKQIINTTGLDAAAVYIVRQKSGPQLVREKVVKIWVRDERQDGEALEAAGRTNDMRMRRLTVLCYTRNLLDEAARDTDRLTDWSLGQLKFEDAVYNSCQLFQPTDNQLNLITDQPIRTGTISDPLADGKNGEFTVSGIELEVRYNRVLNQAQQ